MTRDETRGGRQLSDLGGARGLCGNKPPPGATWSQAAQQVRPSPHFQINCLIIAPALNRALQPLAGHDGATPHTGPEQSNCLPPRQSRQHSIDRNSILASILSLSPLEEAGDQLRTHRHGLLEWPQGAQPHFYHSVTPSLRSPSVLSCAGLGPRERRGAERDSRAL